MSSTKNKIRIGQVKMRIGQKADSEKGLKIRPEAGKDQYDELLQDVLDAMIEQMQELMGHTEEEATANRRSSEEDALFHPTTWKASLSAKKYEIFDGCVLNVRDAAEDGAGKTVDISMSDAAIVMERVGADALAGARFDVSTIQRKLRLEDESASQGHFEIDLSKDAVMELKALDDGESARIDVEAPEAAGIDLKADAGTAEMRAGADGSDLSAEMALENANGAVDAMAGKLGGQSVAIFKGLNDAGAAIEMAARDNDARLIVADGADSSFKYQSEESSPLELAHEGKGLEYQEKAEDGDASLDVNKPAFRVDAQLHVEDDAQFDEDVQIGANLVASTRIVEHGAFADPDLSVKGAVRFGDGFEVDGPSYLDGGLEVQEHDNDNLPALLVHGDIEGHGGLTLKSELIDSPDFQIVGIDPDGLTADVVLFKVDSRAGDSDEGEAARVADVQFYGDLLVSNNFTVMGSTNTVNKSELVIEDGLITVANGLATAAEIATMGGVGFEIASHTGGDGSASKPMFRYGHAGERVWDLFDHDRNDFMKLHVGAFEADDDVVLGDGKPSDTLTVYMQSESKTLVGNATEVIGGSDTYTLTGARSQTLNSTDTYTLEGARSQILNSTDTFALEGARSQALNSDDTYTLKGARSQTIGMTDNLTLGGNRTQALAGSDTYTLEGARSQVLSSSDSYSALSRKSVITNKEEFEAGSRIEKIEGSDAHSAASRSSSISNADELAAGSRKVEVKVDDALTVGKNRTKAVTGHDKSSAATMEILSTGDLQIASNNGIGPSYFLTSDSTRTEWTRKFDNMPICDAILENSKSKGKLKKVMECKADIESGTQLDIASSAAADGKGRLTVARPFNGDYDGDGAMGLYDADCKEDVMVFLNGQLLDADSEKPDFEFVEETDIDGAFVRAIGLEFSCDLYMGDILQVVCARL